MHICFEQLLVFCEGAARRENGEQRQRK